MSTVPKLQKCVSDHLLLLVGHLRLLGLFYVYGLFTAQAGCCMSPGRKNILLLKSQQLMHKIMNIQWRRTRVCPSGFRESAPPTYLLTPLFNSELAQFWVFPSLFSGSIYRRHIGFMQGPLELEVSWKHSILVPASPLNFWVLPTRLCVVAQQYVWSCERFGTISSKWINPPQKNPLYLFTYSTPPLFIMCSF